MGLGAFTKIVLAGTLILGTGCKGPQHYFTPHQHNNDSSRTYRINNSKNNYTTGTTIQTKGDAIRALVDSTKTGKTIKRLRRTIQEETGINADYKNIGRHINREEDLRGIEITYNKTIPINFFGAKEMNISIGGGIPADIDHKGPGIGFFNITLK